ncbi:MAG: hypothetical protein FJ138_19030, partial [Deltaproteobacteria bacterium]|nr:hypothetical protein [Deltaproteobacteria bacterium]
MTFKLEGHAHEVLLGAPLSAGERATVYEISAPSPTLKALCVKVYHAAPTAARLAKLRAMVKLPTANALRAQHVCWPISLVSAGAERGEARVVGYLTLRAHGVPLAALADREERRARLAHWDRLSLCVLLRTWLTQTRHLNDAGVLLTDLRDEHVLFDALNPERLYLVSLDAAQVGAHLGAVAAPELLAPELQGRRKSASSRVEIDEAQQRFAVAARLFGLLVPGGAPHSLTPREDLAALAAQRFPSPPEPPADAPPPPDPRAPRALRSWALLTPALRDIFRRCFAHGERP